MEKVRFRGRRRRRPLLLLVLAADLLGRLLLLLFLRRPFLDGRVAFAASRLVAPALRSRTIRRRRRIVGGRKERAT